MKTIRDIEHLEGVKVLLRADFNVPISEGRVTDDLRIRKAVPTMKYLLERGATVIAVSHLESPSGESLSLEPVAHRLSECGLEAVFVKDWKKIGELSSSASGTRSGKLFLMENIRFFPGEVKNDPKFASELASLADIYVNEAFPVSHREHASVVGVPRLIPGYIGEQFEKEVVNLSKAFHPEHPFLFILCGAKFETKMPLLRKFNDLADRIFVGGALANDIFRFKGYNTGTSLVSDTSIDLASFDIGGKVKIPIDIVTMKGVARKSDGMSSDDKVADAGPETMQELQEMISTAKFILWNGPLGIYEDGFKDTTKKLAQMIAEKSASGATSIVGGGDTLAAISELGIDDRFTFVSTGGGAMLAFLADETLPGIEALERSQ